MGRRIFLAFERGHYAHRKYSNDGNNPKQLDKSESVFLHGRTFACITIEETARRVNERKTGRDMMSCRLSVCAESALMYVLYYSTHIA
jgi:hypothetical protein